jgi:hypothetical protein
MSKLTDDLRALADEWRIEAQDCRRNGMEASAQAAFDHQRELLAVIARHEGGGDVGG